MIIYFNTKKKKKALKRKSNSIEGGEKKQCTILVPNIVRFDQFKMHAILAFLGTPNQISEFKVVSITKTR